VQDGVEYLGNVAVYDPPLLEVEYALDPRDPGASAVSHLPSSEASAWHAVALSSQLRSLYEISNDGATARKVERDAYVDALRMTRAMAKGVHRFRLRIDETAGDDFCNHVGFIAGPEGSYRGSALNSADSCCIEIDSARVMLDGRACSRISRRPVKGDVLILQIDLDSTQFSVGIEGEAMTSVYWSCQKRPVYLAVSFRRIGWKVTLLSTESGALGQLSRKEQARRDMALARSSLKCMSPDITLFQAMLEVLNAAESALAAAKAGSGGHAASGGDTAAGSASQSMATDVPGGVCGGVRKASCQLAAASQLALQAQARQPYRLVYQVRVSGLEECRWLLAASAPHSSSAACHSTSGIMPASNARGRSRQVWLEERPLHAGSGTRAAALVDGTLEQQLRAAGLGEQACCAARLLCLLYRHEPSRSDKAAVSPANRSASAAVAVASIGDAPSAAMRASEYTVSVSPEALLNRKLTRKLSGVLGDVVSVASGCIPEWCQMVPSLCPFLFSFSTREQLVKCTAFGTSQTIFWLQEQRVDPMLRRRLREAENTIGQVTEMSGEAAQRAYDRLMHAQEAIERQRIGKLRSDIARVSRDERILSQADALMRVHADVTRMLEVQFIDEHGFGWGVTQGFYTAVALELQRADGDVCIWRDADPIAAEVAGAGGAAEESAPNAPASPTAKYTNRVYVQVGAEGLFPRPMHAKDGRLAEVCERMRLLGRLIAKALRDGFNVPLPLSSAFFAAGCAPASSHLAPSLVCCTPSAVTGAMHSTQQDSAAAFASRRVYLERVLTRRRLQQRCSTKSSRVRTCQRRPRRAGLLAASPTCWSASSFSTARREGSASKSCVRLSG
jgi:hypothetical protein